MLKDLKNFIEAGKFDAYSLQKFKNQIAKKINGNAPRRNSDFLAIYREYLEKKQIEKSPELERLLRIRKVRTSSGVSVVSLLMKHFPCPGECTFCPTEKNMPKSYLSNEPAVMRAIRVQFSPKRQVDVRLEMLKKTGHPTQKVEIIVMGGTFSTIPKKYRTNFIRGILAGLNKKNLSLEKAKQENEKAVHRCVGLTLETRPDYINEKEIKDFRRLACTRVEVGVQSFSDEILKKVKRGHSVKKTKEATRLLKDAGLKIVYHLMPGLPGSSVNKDIGMIRECFENEDFKPDWLKIYPCVVTKNCELYNEVKKGEFFPLDAEKTAEIIIKAKKYIPPWARLNRVIRDIPSTSIAFGSKVTNLRQEISKRAKCRCIRCREIREENFDANELKLKRRDFSSSGGREFFLSFEDLEKDKIVSLLRLRFPSQVFTGDNHFISALNGSSIIRELHTFGVEEDIGHRQENSQHRGLGKRLILEAEKITRDFGLKKIAVIAGVGVRSYYRKLGYKLEDEYMVKSF